jgi:hypothetical protein
MVCTLILQLGESIGRSPTHTPARPANEQLGGVEDRFRHEDSRWTVLGEPTACAFFPSFFSLSSRFAGEDVEGPAQQPRRVQCLRACRTSESLDGFLSIHPWPGLRQLGWEIPEAQWQDAREIHPLHHHRQSHVVDITISARHRSPEGARGTASKVSRRHNETESASHTCKLR